MKKITKFYFIGLMLGLIALIGARIYSTAEGAGSSNNIAVNNDGTLTVYTEEGDVYYQYSGTIDILNDGTDGNKINIKIVRPGPVTCNDGLIYDSPIGVTLYDKTNKAISQYSAYPEFVQGGLRLHDAELLHSEHDCEWDDTASTQ